MDIVQSDVADRSQKAKLRVNQASSQVSITYPKLFTPGHFNNRNTSASEYDRKLQI